MKHPAILVLVGLAVAAVLSGWLFVDAVMPATKGEEARPFDIACVDGSRWKGARVIFSPSAYDLYQYPNGPFIARVPVNLCSLLAAP